MPPLDIHSGDAKDLVALLKGMMKQFAEGMGLDAKPISTAWRGWERRCLPTCSER